MGMMTKNSVSLPGMQPSIVQPYAMHRYLYSHSFDEKGANLNGTFDPNAIQNGL